MILNSWGAAIVGLWPIGLGGLFLILYILGYYNDFKRNPKYYAESFSFWVIFTLGAIVIHLVVTKGMGYPQVGWSLVFVWFSWVAYRLGTNNKKEKK
ncbi:MAG: hypothetical protein IT244_04480 [Bacteroidia bacterium]|nr:hypothetical protein [Bacteroidia bacterium]